MRILSNFRDYYDGVQRHYHGACETYIRRTETLNGPAIDLPYGWYDHPYDHQFWVVGGYLGYCGTLRPLVTIDDLQRTVYSFDSLLALTGRVNLRYRQLFENPPPAKLKKLFSEHCTPLFLIQTIHHQPQLILHPKLEDLEFGSVKDAYSCYQDIRSYVTGVLTKEGIEPRPIDDQIKRDLGGFDDHSFKRTEHPRKARRKR
jgi:hypothetical protein